MMRVISTVPAVCQCFFCLSCRLSVFLLPVRVQDGLMLASCASFFGKKEQG